MSVRWLMLLLGVPLWAWGLACEREAAVAADQIMSWPDGLAPCDPTAAEICNGRDDDCDDDVDEEEVCADPCRPVRLGPRAVIRADGAVFGWRPDAMDVGTGVVVAQRVQLPEPAVQVTAGCGRGVSGRAYCWSRASGWPNGRPPTRLLGAGNTVAQLARGEDSWFDLFVCGRRSGTDAGSVWCWSSGSDPDPPWRLAGPDTPAAQLAAGGDPASTCALLVDGTIWCTPSTRGEPLALMPLGQENVEVALGEAVCGRKASGEVLCADTPFAQPRPLTLGRPVRQLDLHRGVCGLRDDGSVVCWSNGSSAPSGAPAEAPVATLRIVPGLEHDVADVVAHCARKRDHTVWCWSTPLVGPGFYGPPREARRLTFCPEQP